MGVTRAPCPRSFQAGESGSWACTEGSVPGTGGHVGLKSSTSGLAAAAGARGKHTAVLGRTACALIQHVKCTGSGAVLRVHHLVIGDGGLWTGGR